MMEDSESIERAEGGIAEAAGLPVRGGDLATIHELPADVVPLIPVRSSVLFPGMVLPFGIGRPGSIAAAQQAARSERPVGLVMQRDPTRDEPSPEDLHSIGTIARVVRYVTTTDGGHHVVCQGEERFRVLEVIRDFPFLAARIERIPEIEQSDGGIEARMLLLKQRAAEALQLLPQTPHDLVAAIQSFSAPGALADMVAGFMDIKPEQKQDILETVDIERRLDKVLALLAHRIAVMRLSREIGSRTQEKVDERQREFMLREQMKQIQRELGDDAEATELEELARQIEAAGMPEEALQLSRKELARLKRMSDSSAEYSMVRSYLEWMVELPWSVTRAGDIDLASAREVLDADHFGLEKIKRRIVEYLAVRKLNPEGKAPILCFVGPPGVGKTSLGQSIARALGTAFVRVALGGVHDEAEIRGHRRTYVGALPGNVIQSLRKAGSRDTVMLLDEVDKLGAGGFHGDPSAALLEVLDPEQNSAFRDAYLGTPFDLSRITFIATANVLESIPGPLRDRMEVIELPGYTESEKVAIARRHLLRKQAEANGLGGEERMRLADEVLREIVRGYTREAGVRGLERRIAAVCRHVAVRVATGHEGGVEVGLTDLADILGPRRFENESALRAGLAGVATGLAWTPAGGDVLFIEATKTPGSGRLIVTGQLGEVMKESVQAALTLVKSRSAALGIEPLVFEKTDLHVHVPAGATPKDGPSAGVGMFLAIASIFTGQVVRPDTAMTGEISLRGLVLPVGGIKEKVLAAAQAGVRTVMLPARNRADYPDIPAEARDALQFVWLEDVDGALAAGLEAGSVKKVA
jgi:ATP-dependent Lon protease